MTGFHAGENTRGLRAGDLAEDERSERCEGVVASIPALEPGRGINLDSRAGMRLLPSPNGDSARVGRYCFFTCEDSVRFSASWSEPWASPRRACSDSLGRSG